jgi:hypothetical protein
VREAKTRSGGRIGLRLAAERDDDPPAISHVHVAVDLETDAAPARVVGIVERELRTGTITRTVARAVDYSMTLSVNGTEWPTWPPSDWLREARQSGDVVLIRRSD